MKLFSYQMSIGWIYLAILAFCLYIYFGLHITENLETFVQKILGWIIYTLLWITFLNVFTISYFWSVVRNKTGPYGIRGPEGDQGSIGMQGECGQDMLDALCMQMLNHYINDLYKKKTNTSILNEETQKFPCTYLNEKVKALATSRQFEIINGNLSNDDKPSANLINYLKSIWHSWFELIYNATSPLGAWFNDEFGDEQYNWVGTNPFIEIKKYDVYYWGTTRDFRPLKAEVCRSTANNNSDKMPNQNLPKSADIYDEPRLKIMETNYYKYITNSEKTGGNNDVSFWRPRPVLKNEQTYYPVGDIIMQSRRGGEHSFYNPAPKDAIPNEYSERRVKEGNLIIGETQYPDPRDFSLESNRKYFQGYTEPPTPTQTQTPTSTSTSTQTPSPSSTNSLSKDQIRFIQTGSGPDLTSIVVAGDVVDPISYDVVKDINDNGAWENKNIRLKCPEGYTSMGDFMVSSVFDKNFDAIRNDKVKCVPTECLEPLVAPSFRGIVMGEPDYFEKMKKLSEEIKSGAKTPQSKWNFNNEYSIYDLKNSGDKDIERAAYQNGYNLFRVGPDMTAPFYKIKKSCLVKTPKIRNPEVKVPKPPSTKELEPKNDELGIGWYGHPYKLDPKYSIFSFLNLVPEGIIIHVGTGDRFYIVHVEGDDINLFNILTYNNATNKYDGALKALDYNHSRPAPPQYVKYSGTVNDPNLGDSNLYDKNEIETIPEYNPDKRIDIQKLDKFEKRQQWKIIIGTDKKVFRLKNIVKNTYLYIGQDPVKGHVEFSTVDMDNNNYVNDPAFQNLSPGELDNKTNFSFISAFGPQLNIIDESGE